MGRVRDRIKRRRAAKNPKQQYYGGSQEAYEANQRMAGEGRRAGEARLEEGLGEVSRERLLAAQRSQVLDQVAEAEGGQQRLRAGVYGAEANRSLSDYRGGREALLGSAGGIDANATAMEQIARSAPGQYQSAADAAFRASTERNQRNALSLAAGRGPGATRMALATAGANNAQAQLDQQATRAQEMNQLLGLQTQAYQGAAGVRGTAAGVRSSVSAQDQAAAQLQAQRQQAAAAAGLQTAAQRAQLAGADAAIGANAAGTVANAGAQARDAYLGAGQTTEVAQLGQNAAYEQLRQANAKTKGPFQKIGSVIFDPMNFRGSESGGLGSVY